MTERSEVDADIWCPTTEFGPPKLPPKFLTVIQRQSKFSSSSSLLADHAPFTLKSGFLHIYILKPVAERRPARSSSTMSRGGRGGGRGGGGFGRGKMGGVDLPWEYDPELEIKTKPTELFPVSPFHAPKIFTSNHHRSLISLAARNFGLRGFTKVKYPWEEMSNARYGPRSPLPASKSRPSAPWQSTTSPARSRDFMD
ncbi:hypothetical protein AOQ84DRAFT_8175 [Glonium stellatum]|uniref:Uncharacterized protein n=1 Tax=Glonium stellatum TaxID=574774 RepID=A0A8E2F3Y6_9PEZI|nr:hypothetical protein AOQ84DRAFT_8175 [Glonium stellatum]